MTQLALRTTEIVEDDNLELFDMDDSETPETRQMSKSESLESLHAKRLASGNVASMEDIMKDDSDYDDDFEVEVERLEAMANNEQQQATNESLRDAGTFMREYNQKISHIRELFDRVEFLQSALDPTDIHELLEPMQAIITLHDKEISESTLPQHVEERRRAFQTLAYCPRGFELRRDAKDAKESLEHMKEFALYCDELSNECENFMEPYEEFLAQFGY